MKTLLDQVARGIVLPLKYPYLPLKSYADDNIQVIIMDISLNIRLQLGKEEMINLKLS